MVDKRCVRAFYGIRGVSSAYYLAYALGREAFTRPEYLWSVGGLTILDFTSRHDSHTGDAGLGSSSRPHRSVADQPKAFRSGQAT